MPARRSQGSCDQDLMTYLVIHLFAGQARLKAQQAALAARLQQALQLAQAPQTKVDTDTVADKAVHLLDMMLEVPQILG